MIKNLFFFLILIPALAQAQFTIKGSIKPNHNYTWVLLYKLEKGKQIFVDNASVVNGEFQFKIDKKQPPGIYRAYYQIENNLYVEFIYNKENIDFTFNPNNPIDTIDFLTSDENTIYQRYYKKISEKQKQLDALQVAYFKEKDTVIEKRLIDDYKNTRIELQSLQSLFEKETQGKLAQHFIKASKQYNAQEPFKSPQDYIAAVKVHFFDAIEFNDTFLSNSTFINDRLMDYVLYLNQANNITSKNILQKKATSEAAQILNKNFELLKNFEESLLQSYMFEENTEMIYFVMNNYYNLLPDIYQDAALQYKISAAMKTAIGTVAADFSWEENGVKKNLHGLIGFDYYIIVFFSATCPHCQVELPEFYTFINDIENIRVITVGLEDEKENWRKMTADFVDFTNILDLEKWNSPKVKDYGITAIPSYFVLDANKNILAKPNDVKELKAMFETK